MFALSAAATGPRPRENWAAGPALSLPGWAWPSCVSLNETKAFPRPCSTVRQEADTPRTSSQADDGHLNPLTKHLLRAGPRAGLGAWAQPSVICILASSLGGSWGTPVLCSTEQWDIRPDPALCSLSNGPLAAAQGGLRLALGSAPAVWSLVSDVCRVRVWGGGGSARGRCQPCCILVPRPPGPRHLSAVTWELLGSHSPSPPPRGPDGPVASSSCYQRRPPRGFREFRRPHSARGAGQSCACRDGQVARAKDSGGHVFSAGMCWWPREWAVRGQEGAPGGRRGCRARRRRPGGRSGAGALSPHELWPQRLTRDPSGSWCPWPCPRTRPGGLGPPGT